MHNPQNGFDLRPGQLRCCLLQNILAILHNTVLTSISDSHGTNKCQRQGSMELGAGAGPLVQLALSDDDETSRVRSSSDPPQTCWNGELSLQSTSYDAGKMIPPSMVSGLPEASTVFPSISGSPLFLSMGLSALRNKKARALSLLILKSERACK